MGIKKIFMHFHLVNKHRYKVFKLCVKAGIPFRGLVHDLSKYSPTEFIESAKNYDGKVSPVKVCKQKYGYSKVWLHHKGRNKHHFEYWLDMNTPIKTPIMPYKYTVEMICDNIAAGMTYMGKEWSPKYCYEYFAKRNDKEYMNELIKNILEEVYSQMIDEGLNKTINKKNLKRIYYKHIKKDIRNQ